MHVTQDKVGCRRLRVIETQRLSGLSMSNILQVKTESVDYSKPQQCIINLSGLWSDTKVKPNTIIHLIGAEFDSATSTFTVTNNNGLLVIDPDELMPCTYLVSSLFCARKSWLNQIFSGWISTNQAMLIGTMVHEVFQHACEHKLIDEEKLFQVLVSKIDNWGILQQSYAIDLDLEMLLKQCKEYIPSISGWLKKYLLIGPLSPLTNDTAQLVKVQQIKDIEETIWATKYGLKGKIDLTGVVKIHDQRSGISENKILPLELKTGSQYYASSHVGQVSLYSFMIEDRHGVTDQGLLIYLKNKPELHSVKVNYNHRRDLMILRNKLTEHQEDFTYGPEFKNSFRECSRCERLVECLLMGKLFHSERLKTASVMKSLEQEALGHLSEYQINFFKYWMEILSNEICESQRRARDANTFWTYDSTQAESQGSGLSKLVIKATKVPTVDAEDNINFSQPGILVLERHPAYLKSLGPLKNENLSRRRIAISIDDDSNRDMTSQNINIAKTTGLIIFSDTTMIKVAADNILPLSDEENLYRIDFLESTRKGTQALTNIVRLMYPINWRYDHLREILIPEPNHKRNLKLALDLGGFITRSTSHIMQPLDFEQKKLLIRAAISDDYYFLDETRLSDKNRIAPTLVAFLKIVLHLNRTILVIGSSLESMNLMLQQMRIEKMDFLTLGASDPDFKDYEIFNQINSGYNGSGPITYDENSSNHEDNLVAVKAKFSGGFEKLDNCKILITTYNNISRSPIFERRIFDYCLMFDCDKTDLPNYLEPMFICDRYVIVDYRSNEDNGRTQGDGTAADVKDVKKKLILSLGDHLRQLSSQS